MTHLPEGSCRGERQYAAMHLGVDRSGHLCRMPLRVYAWCGLLAPVAFTVGWLVGGLAQPDEYRTIDDHVSDLGGSTANSPWLYNQIGANLTGFLVIGLAAGLRRTVRSGVAGRVGVIALGVTGIGQFFDGWFRLDCRAIDPGCNGTDPSWHEIAHDIESRFTALGLLVSVFALARAFTTRRVGMTSEPSRSRRASRQSLFFSASFP
jgi:hypothetical protein